MIYRTLVATAIVAIGLGAPPVAANAQVSLEVRGGLQRPMGSFEDNATGEYGFGGDVFFQLNQRLSVYGGYGAEWFGCDGCDEDDGSTSRGFEGGLKAVLGSAPAGILPWIRAGATFHQLRVDVGGVSATSDRRVGIQAAVGFDIAFGEALFFSPALRYQAYEAEFPFLNDLVSARRDVSFVSLDLGIHIHPGG